MANISTNIRRQIVLKSIFYLLNFFNTCSGLLQVTQVYIFLLENAGGFIWWRPLSCCFSFKMEQVSTPTGIV